MLARDRSASLLELFVDTAEGDVLIIHAMPLRAAAHRELLE